MCLADVPEFHRDSDLAGVPGMSSASLGKVDYYAGRPDCSEKTRCGQS